MSIAYEAGGRTAQKQRTRTALIDAARALVAGGTTPTVEDAAAAASISRATAYRYFPSQWALLVAAHPTLDDFSLLPPDAPADDVAARLELAVERFTELVVETEPQQRTMLRLSLEADDEARRQLLLRQGRAIEWLKEALAPLREAMSDDDLHRLVVAIRSAIGIEAFVWLVDVAGLDRAAATASMRWSARSPAGRAERGARALGSSPRRLCRSVMDDLKLGMQLGYWTAQPPTGREIIETAQEAETLGFDSLWTGESWSSDAFSPLVWAGAHTTRVKLATGIAQMSARSPVTMAMHAHTLDVLTEGRFRLGIGVSGPQVVEGWYGRPFGMPLARTREYIDILRQVWRREEPVTNDGLHYPMPYTGEGSVGLGKPLKLISHPPRPDIPIYLGAEGPKNVRLATELTDGWVPLYYSPYRNDVYADQLQGAKPGFEVAVNVSVTIADDVATALLPVKGSLGFYIGGMGARSRNFHMELMSRMGFEEEAHHIQDLFFEGKREEAVMAVPDAFADEISLVGPPGRIKERLAAWRDTPVTTILVGSRDPDVLQLMADLTT